MAVPLRSHHLNLKPSLNLHRMRSYDSLLPAPDLLTSCALMATASSTYSCILPALKWTACDITVWPKMDSTDYSRILDSESLLSASVGPTDLQPSSQPVNLCSVSLQPAPWHAFLLHTFWFSNIRPAPGWLDLPSACPEPPIVELHWRPVFIQATSLARLGLRLWSPQRSPHGFSAFGFLCCLAPQSLLNTCLLPTRQIWQLLG